MIPKRTCKLCGGLVFHRFSLGLIGNRVGDYFECESCQMLQSFHLDLMSPGALQDFYARTDPSLDSGSAWRQYCISNRIGQLVKMRILPDRDSSFKVLDYGCGSGFVASFLAFRFGWDVLGYDPYSVPTFSPNQVLNDWEEVRGRGPFNLVIATEVFEHFRFPAEQLIRLGNILSQVRSFVFITTGVYHPDSHDQNWTYLGPHSGQHVSFYSRKALCFIGSIFNSCSVKNVGAEYEWLFVVGSKYSAPSSKLKISMKVSAIREAVKWGILSKIE